ncbi:MAG TPA: hypothetical protein VHS97_13870, partial [Isosphaeraceae bacterium]|nr:hypothetical protein [Isosphaeraceae bacterium]
MLDFELFGLTGEKRFSRPGYRTSIIWMDRHRRGREVERGLGAVVAELFPAIPQFHAARLENAVWYF